QAPSWQPLPRTSSALRLSPPASWEELPVWLRRGPAQEWREVLLPQTDESRRLRLRRLHPRRPRTRPALSGRRCPLRLRSRGNLPSRLRCQERVSGDQAFSKPPISNAQSTLEYPFLIAGQQKKDGIG